MRRDKIAMAMSGGVDSSAAAALLISEGYEVIGFSMQLWNQRDHAAGMQGDGESFGSCCSLDDLHDARRVAGHLSIPYYVLNLEKDFLSQVVRPFVSSYMKGETPSPCVLCNTHLKFDRLMRFSRQVDADFVATGHYARIEYDPCLERFLLLRGADRSKDQSYFLFELSQTQLSRILLPLGHLTKKRVRELAREQGLPVADKSESQEICFVGNGKYDRFIEAHSTEIMAGATDESIEDLKGDIVDEEGRILGTHEGIHRFTVGQRRGLGLSAPDPLYVLGIDSRTKQVSVGPRERLNARELVARDPNWIAVGSLHEPTRVMAKIRSHAPEAPATIRPLSDGRVGVAFDDPLRAITPGQAVVFYQEERVLGGGWIEHAKA